MTNYSEKFKKAVEFVIKNEGGYVFDKNDLGGVTKYGISQKAYPALNINGLQREDAIKIYYCDYWLKGKFEQISDDTLATQLFDLSVNLGIKAETIVLQRALRSVGMNVQEDGFRPCDAFRHEQCRYKRFAGCNKIRSCRILSTDCSEESKSAEIFKRLAQSGLQTN
jgi:hypothetical protein